MAESTRTSAGDRWRQLQDAARGQAQRLADVDWQPASDPYAGRIDSFRAGPRTDENLVDLLAGASGSDASVLEIGAGAGRLCVPLARRVREVIALEPSPSMAEALAADASAAGASNLRVVRAGWQDCDEHADLVYAAHVVYALPEIEAFIARLEQTGRRRCALVVFAEPPQSRLFGFWQAVYGEPRNPNPYLPHLLDVLWSRSVYPDVTMLEVPIWPLGPAPRARAGLRRRLRIAEGSAADARLERAMAELLVDWGEGVLGPRDRRPLPVGVVHWAVRG